MSIVTEVSAKRSRSGEKSCVELFESAFKTFDEACNRHIQVHKQTAEHVKEIAKRNHDACEKAKREQRRQENDRIISKAAKEKHLSEIEARLNVMFYGFENVKKVSDKSKNKVDSIAKRMDTVLSDVAMMREECEAKDAEILRLNSRIDRQDKEIEALKSMIREQARMLELYMQINERDNL